MNRTSRISTSRISWQIKRSIVRLRWPGVAGLALLLFAIGVTLFTMQSSQRRISSAGEEMASIKARVSKRDTFVPAPTGRSQLSNFYAFFPLVEHVPELLGRVHGAANDHQILLEKGEYKLSREADFPLARYQVTLPVHGQYADLRGFVNDVLAAVPSAALEELTLKRDSIEAPEVDGRVRFTLFLGTR